MELLSYYLKDNYKQGSKHPVSVAKNGFMFWLKSLFCLVYLLVFFNLKQTEKANSKIMESDIKLVPGKHLSILGRFRNRYR